MNRRLECQGKMRVEPLYTSDDVHAVEGRFQGLPYGEAREIARGVTLRFSDAGHILGSASVETDRRRRRQDARFWSSRAILALAMCRSCATLCLPILPPGPISSSWNQPTATMIIDP